jgi:peptidoglycan/xylan/chitin deacetylase (PgdA/CDA1 family)
MLEIIMLHNVKKKVSNVIGPISDYAVTEKQLEYFIVSRKNWLKISPSDLCSTPKEKKAFLLTFDDGYLDNLTSALPILERYNIPCIIFCTTGFINGSIYPYEVELAEIIEYYKHLKIGENKGEVSIDNCSKKNEIYQKLRIPLKRKSHDKRDTFMKNLAKANNYDRKEFQKEQFLSWNNIRDLSEHPLITIGAHTIHHEQLSKLSLLEAYNEISGSKKAIESIINKRVEYFSYPYGANSFFIRNLFRMTGFKYAFSTRDKHIRNFNEVNRTDIPRTGISNLV